MAASAATASHLLSPLYQIEFPKCPLLSSQSQFRPRPLRSQTQRTTIRATSAVVVESDLSTQKNQASEVDLFACPICYEPLIRKGPIGLNLSAIYRSGFQCKRCKKSYSSKDGYLDLTVTAGFRDYTEIQPARTELFSYKYVGDLSLGSWHAIIFKMAQDYFEPAKGGLIVDVSCGSGLFSRKFAQSGTYSGVVALDFSENMLRQCYDFIKKEDALSSANIALVRADVSRLPFASRSVDAVHAGAALHCWPSPSNAVAEITRILRSGGIFVGTTFLRYTSSTSWIVRPFRERTSQGYGFLTGEEIKDLCTSCGLTSYSSKIQQSFIMFTAQKP